MVCYQHIPIRREFLFIVFLVFKGYIEIFLILKFPLEPFVFCHLLIVL